MLSQRPIPLLCTGKAERVGSLVCEQMKPEFEVIHFTLADAIEKELPLLLKGEIPNPSSSSIATGNWSSPPLALMLGGAYQDEDIRHLQKLMSEAGPSRKIPWIRIDSSKSESKPGTPQYADEVVRRMKEGLLKLKEDGELSEGNDRVYAV